LRIQIVSAVGLRAQRRAADGRAVDGEMDARIVVFGRAAQEIVLDAVERFVLSEQGEKLALPRRRKQRAEIADGLKIGIAAQDQVDGPTRCMR
jgi:hypothetical protein